MPRLSKVKPVAAFELGCTVRSKSWLITTFGMPVFMLLYASVISIPIYLEARKERQVAVWGLVDEAGITGLEQDVAREALKIPAEIASALEASGQRALVEQQIAWVRNLVFRPFPSAALARESLIEGRIRGYFVVPADWVATGVVESWMPAARAARGADSRRALANLLVERLVRGKLAAEVATRIEEPITETREWIVTQEGEVKRTAGAGRVVRALVPIGFAILLLMSILMGAGGLIQTTAIEKENKVVEVLLSSAEPDEILFGKLLGQGAAGTLQMVVWFGMAGVAGAVFTGAMATIGVEPPWIGMAAAVLLFPLAYLFFGSLMLGTGSLGSNQTEATQWGMAWVLLAAVPLVMLQSLLDEPHGVAAHVLTWLPFAAPTVIVFRLTVDPGGIAWWEIAGAVLVLFGSIWATIRLSARLFRVGIMLTGARPKLREILRQARL